MSEGSNDECSSSCYNLQMNSIDSSNEEELAKFRREWRQEFVGSSSEQSASSTALRVLHEEDEEELSSPKSSSQTLTEQQLLSRAHALYGEGAALEREGELFLAIRKYRRAEHLVPDIERRICDLHRRNADKNEENRENEDNKDEEEIILGTDDYDEDEDELELDEVAESNEDLVADFERLQLKRMWCEPQHVDRTSSMHIGYLPTELVIHVLKWVVSSDLDLVSLERCSQVCRGLYLAARSPHIWRLVCNSTWGNKESKNRVDKNLDRSDAEAPFCWRTLYLSRPRLMFNGLYISRMSYTREGERSFQDNEFARSWHLVAYYRYIRFVAGGQVAMATSAEQPANAVKSMKKPFDSFGRLQGTALGRFTTMGNRVLCVFKKDSKSDFYCSQLPRMGRARRQQRQQQIYKPPEQEFHVELEIRGKRFNQLHWVRYEVVSRYEDGSESRSDIDVSHSFSFPRLIFSRVRSYTDQCSAPLT